MSSKTFEDGFNLLCGRKIGEGMTRDVYECNIRNDVVVKVESADVRTHFQNLIEWHVWGRMAGTDFEQWFAPVVAISPDGRLLVMRRTTPHGGTLPGRIPTFFTDLKPSNFGFIDGRFVCHDYASNLLMERGMSKRMKTVRWYERD